jgi:hypothetical protein
MQTERSILLNPAWQRGGAVRRANDAGGDSTAARATVMQAPSGDAAEYAFLTTPGARVQCRLVEESGGTDLQVFGNRAGLLSFANLLLWFVANAWRREFLSFGELGFVHLEGRLAVSLRIADEVPADSSGILHLRDRAESLEWEVAEEGLKQVALWMHSLVSTPGHEYDRLLVADGSECGVHVRMTDAAEWVRRGVS